MNVGEQYLPWRDFSLRVEGPAVETLQRAFADRLGHDLGVREGTADHRRVGARGEDVGNASAPELLGDGQGVRAVAEVEIQQGKIDAVAQGVVKAVLQVAHRAQHLEAKILHEALKHHTKQAVILHDQNSHTG